VTGAPACGTLAACVGMPFGHWAAAPASGGLSASARAEAGVCGRVALPVEVSSE